MNTTTFRRKNAFKPVKWTEAEIDQVRHYIEVEGRTHQGAADAMGKGRRQVSALVARMGFRPPRAAESLKSRYHTKASRARVNLLGNIYRELQDPEAFDAGLAARAQRNAVHERLGGCRWLPPDRPSIYREFCHADTVGGTHWCAEHIKKVYIHGKPPASRNQQAASPVDPFRRPAVGKRFSST